MRRVAIQVIGLLALVGLVWAVNTVRRAESASAGSAAPLAPVAYLPVVAKHDDSAYVNPFGVAMYEGLTDALGLQRMSTAGSRWVTTYLYWFMIEPNRPVGGVHTYNWSNFDAEVSRAQALGLSLYVLFNGNPRWAAVQPSGLLTNTAALVSFASAMTERYDGDGYADAPGHPVINDWSFYPEPDNENPVQDGQGQGWGNHPREYAAMLSQVSPAIHAANPQARVIIGGLAYDWFTTDPRTGPFVRSFLPNTLSALNGYPGGARRYIDGVGFHFYPISTWRWPTIREKALEIRGLMQQAGVGDLPVIAPEMGDWSDTNRGSSQTRQAQSLVQMYARGLSVGIQRLSWFAVFDDAGGTGLFLNDSIQQPKLAYTAYATLTAELSGFHFDHTFVAAQVEGYVFRQADQPDLTIVWATTNPATAAFPLACVRRADVLGSADKIVDGGPNDVDARINAQVTIALGVNQPVYVSAC